MKTISFVLALFAAASASAQPVSQRTIEEHMRICMTEKCQGPIAMHCRGETPKKKGLRDQCRAEFAAANKK